MAKLRLGSYRKDRKRGNRPIVPTVLVTGGISIDEHRRKTGSARSVYIQGGRFFDPSGKEISDPPKFVLDELETIGKANKKRLTELGFERKFGKIKPIVFEPENEKAEDETAD